MQLSIGLVSRVPAHVYCIHAGKIFVFAIAADIFFADAVVQFATLIFQLVNSEALPNVSAVDY
jgi:hypothetical protein